MWGIAKRQEMVFFSLLTGKETGNQTEGTRERKKKQQFLSKSNGFQKQIVGGVKCAEETLDFAT